ncbi:HNH endonuclease [Pseudomonas sp. NMI4491_12]|uniref:HNH endonuclease n=1 Tax=Pseudomonas sp. NMI4491_12 TaxID=2903146 RepID=UPI001E58E9DB|nr:HNH endonuclease [Pseudomonas sp. NMI4491_12]MCE0968913.1 hypothetical protein [Pseudomonas sp. NMI4491_12]
MSIVTIEFMMLNGGFKLNVGEPNVNGEGLYGDLVRCLHNPGSAEPWKTATPELKLSMAQLVAKYGKLLPALHRLNKKIQAMNIGEKFLVAENMPSDTSERSKLEALVEVLNQHDVSQVKVEWEKRTNEMKNFVGELLQSYNIFTPRFDIRITLGNVKKDDRECRFCSGTLASGSLFTKVAHAVPEALGNKTLILGDECDICNKYFGDSVEPHLIESFDIYRAFLGVRGKNGLPHLKYPGAEITHHEGIPVIIAKKIEFTESSISVDLGGSRKLTPAKLYRALCKITLSVLDEKHLIGLEDTVAWIRNDQPSVALPKVGTNILPVKNDDPQLSVAVFIRKNDDYTLPHIVTEFRFGWFVYVYILPFSRLDKQGFTSDTEFERFWSFFPMYCQTKNWTFEDLHSTKEITIKDSINVKNNSQNGTKPIDDADKQLEI